MTPEQRLAENARQKAEYLQLLQQVRTLPGVEIAALANKVVWTNQDNVPVVSRESFLEGQNRWAAGAYVSEGYFEAMKLPIVRGRPFDGNDTASSPAVAIVSEQLARLLPPFQDCRHEHRHRLKITVASRHSLALPTWANLANERVHRSEVVLVDDGHGEWPEEVQQERYGNETLGTETRIELLECTNGGSGERGDGLRPTILDLRDQPGVSSWERGLAQMPPFPAQRVANRIGTGAGWLAELPADRRVHLGPVLLLVIAIRVLIEPRSDRPGNPPGFVRGKPVRRRPECGASCKWHNNPRDCLWGVECLHQVVGTIERSEVSAGTFSATAPRLA